MADIQTCCNAIAAEIQALIDDVEQSIIDSQLTVQPLFDIINLHQGMFISMVCDRFPTTAELLGRIHSLVIGFSNTQFYEQSNQSPLRTEITIPAQVTDPEKMLVLLNSVKLSYGIDFTLSAPLPNSTMNVIFTYPIEKGDWAEIRTYGA